MPRYSSFGALDDQLVDDADLGFVTWNNRLRPDQLKAGQLADSQNGRMGINGEWQTRKGIDLVVAPLSAGGTALTLPFYLYAQKSVNTASRSGSTVTVSQQTFTPGAAPVSGYEGQYFYRYAQSVAGTGATYNLIAQKIEDVRQFAV